MRSAALPTTSPERTPRRTRHRSRPSRDEAWHHPSAKIPKRREGSYLPDWIQAHRRRSQGSPDKCDRHLRACSGSRHAGSSSWLGAPDHEAAEVPAPSRWPTASDAKLPSLSHPSPRRPAPTRSCWADALVVKVRAAGRTVNVLVLTGVHALGPSERSSASRSPPAKDKAGWLACWRLLVARGLSGVVLVSLRCPPGARLCDRRDPGHLAAPVVPTISRDLLAKVAGSQAALAWQPWCAPSSMRSGATELTASVPTGHRGAGWEAASRLPSTSSKPART